MDVGHDGPAGPAQPRDEAARGFRGVAASLRGPRHHPRDLGRPGPGPARGQRRLHEPGRRAGRADPHHPVAPHLLTARRAARLQPRVPGGQRVRGQRRAAGELVQDRIVQQRRELGGVSHHDRLEIKPLGRPPEIQVDHPSTLTATPPGSWYERDLTAG